MISRHPAFAEWDGKLDQGRFLKFMDAESIDQAWIVSYHAKDTMGYGREEAESAWDFCAGTDRLVALGGFDPSHDGEAASALDYLESRGVQVVKIHPVHQCISPLDSRLTEFWAEVAGRMPVMVHTGPSVFPGACNEFADPALLEPILAKHANLQIILAHGGRPGETLVAQRIMQTYPNAWMDLSGCPPKKIRGYFPELESIAERVLWGTDWPGPGVPSPARNVDAFRALGYGGDIEAGILQKNAGRLLSVVH
jgi:predicted TIM-barrel fold metal-dependent hydrolase